MEAKSVVETIVKKLKNDKSFAKKFKEDPKAAIMSVVGKALAQDKLDDILGALKGKISLDEIGKMLDSDGDGKPDLGAIGNILGKK